MPDDMAALHSLLLLLQGWQLVAATIAILLAGAPSVAALRGCRAASRTSPG